MLSGVAEALFVPCYITKEESKELDKIPEPALLTHVADRAAKVSKIVHYEASLTKEEICNKKQRIVGGILAGAGVGALCGIPGGPPGVAGGAGLGAIVGGITGYVLYRWEIRSEFEEWRGKENIKTLQIFLKFFRENEAFEDLRDPWHGEPMLWPVTCPGGHVAEHRYVMEHIERRDGCGNGCPGKHKPEDFHLSYSHLGKLYKVSTALINDKYKDVVLTEGQRFGIQLLQKDSEKRVRQCFDFEKAKVEKFWKDGQIKPHQYAFRIGILAQQLDPQ